MGHPNKPLPKVTAGRWTLEALHGASAAWGEQAPDPHAGRGLIPDRWVPTFPTSCSSSRLHSSPCCHLSSLFMTQMNFMSRNGVLAVPAWCPHQDNIHHFGCTMNQMLPMAPLCSPIPAVSWDMPGAVKFSFSSGKTPNFPFSGQLGRKSDQQQGSQSSGQVAAGEQEPDGAGVSVPLAQLLSCTHSHWEPFPAHGGAGSHPA